MNRREFIEVSGASLVVASTGKLEALAPEDGKTDLPWQRKLRRIGQVNMTEHDPAVLNVEEWADYWAACGWGLRSSA